MLELTYLKDLPIKLMNENKQVIDLSGATLYIDEAGNRYAFMEFNNRYRRPFFAMILLLSQYDIGGRLVKKERYNIPVCYGNKGLSILDNPIPLERDCEGVEVEILLAVFAKKCFASNKLMSPSSINFDFPRMSDSEPLESEGYVNAMFPTAEREEAPSEAPRPAPAVAPVPPDDLAIYDEDGRVASAASEFRSEPTPEEVRSEPAPRVEPGATEEPLRDVTVDESVLPLGVAPIQNKESLGRYIIPLIAGAVVVLLFLAFYIVMPMLFGYMLIG